MRTIEFTRSAEKEFLRLPHGVQRRFAKPIDRLRSEPLRATPGLDIQRVGGQASAWRLRVGTYRGVFHADRDRIVFVRFGHRSTVNRR